MLGLILWSVKSSRAFLDLLHLGLWYMSVVLTFYSHSIVPGGFEVISYTTLATPLTSLIIREEILFNILWGIAVDVAVIKSVVLTALIATT